MAPDLPYGEIDGAAISSSIFSTYHTIRSQDEGYGNDKSGYEMLQLFSQPLPYGWYMPLVPVALLNRNYHDLWRLLQRNVVVRRQTVRYLNEFNVPTPSIDLMATIYPTLNITVNMKLSAPVPQTLKVRLIQDYAATEIPCQRLPDHAIQVRVRKLRKGEKIKITW
jgi:hypothetical protein